MILWGSEGTTFFSSLYVVNSVSDNFNSVLKWTLKCAENILGDVQAVGIFIVLRNLIPFVLGRIC